MLDALTHGIGIGHSGYFSFFSRSVQQHGCILVNAATSSSWIRLSPHVIEQIFAITHGMIIRDDYYPNKQSYR
ncbi:uncharacterized protein BO87DRAFT_380909 [Aspergillus neoniger CBS 115656]|uniref:Uncharacterized protein n=1 Tax=Aspergillus neoniger (strain CBS 115656) TaxID=1448310 RepID=A0A318Y567_ASPNB|nr:hypothetical protein BO87DRAFT_380909 [Aspergillus neoniger CBS 115656]PYH28969.1 hypothetical protein BO87DRAFT_380909 [Aspergillus neoniger CBS 115656]